MTNYVWKKQFLKFLPIVVQIHIIKNRLHLFGVIMIILGVPFSYIVLFKYCFCFVKFVFISLNKFY